MIIEFIEILKALSDETRYKLLKLSLGQDYCVGALTEKLILVVIPFGY